MKKRVISIRQMFAAMVGIILVFLIAMVCTITISGNRIVYNYVCNIGDATLKYYQESLDNTLTAITSYCYDEIGASDALSVLATAKEPVQIYNLENEIGLTLERLIQIHPQTTFAMYGQSSDPTASIVRTSCDSYAESCAIRDAIMDMVAEEPTTLPELWSWQTLSGTDYLTSIYVFGDAYCAVCLSMDRLASIAEYSLFFTQEGRCIPSAPIASAEALQAGLSSGELTVNGTQYALLTRPSERGNFAMGCLIKASFPALRQQLARNGLILLALMATICVCFSVIFRRLTAFFLSLSSACTSIASGKLDTRIVHNGHLLEINQIYQTFNEMTAQIHDLRISLYEQELRAQRAKMQFLRVQIKSHFFENCLIVIHSLATIGNIPLIQEFSLCLADYFSYLRSGFQDTVRLGSELEHLKSYIRIHEIRYPDRIACTYAIDPDLDDFRVLPMVPQTFVENVFKHGMQPDQKIAILIRAYHGTYNNEHGIWLEICDDGPGFTPAMLQTLNEGHTTGPTPDGHGTGIQNTIDRLLLFYHGRSTIHFSNSADGGAVIRVFFPRMEEAYDEHSLDR